MVQNKKKSKSIKINSLEGLLRLKLKALYDIESLLIKFLPQIVSKAADSDLKASIKNHLNETANQLRRVEDCFRLLDEKPSKTKVEGIRGALNDAKWLLKNIEAGPTLDASIIAIGTQVENYEIATYNSAINWAKLLKESHIIALLTESLNEEISAERDLSWLAATKINERVRSERSSTSIEPQAE